MIKNCIIWQKLEMNKKKIKMDYFNQQSERLIYRKLTLEDIESWSEFFENNDRLHFLGIDKNKSKEVLATGWINKQLGRYENENLGLLGVIEKSNGKLIGMGGILFREFDGDHAYEIAYSLKPSYWGKGFGTEIATQMKQFGTNTKIADSFISIIHKENVDSMKVAKKNGMKILNETEFLGMQVFIFGDEN